MAKTAIEGLANWLDITGQQLSILSIINALKKDEKKASPKNISLEFKKKEGKSIQKSNLFTQIKALMEKDFIEKAGKADYKIVPEAIKSALVEKERTLKEEAESISGLYESLEDYFADIVRDKNEQLVEYLDYESLFDILERKLRYAKEYYIVAKFPGIAYTYTTYSKIKRGKYLETMSRRCFDTKELKITYITQLGLDYPFEHSMRLYGDSKAAYRECEIIIKQLENQVKNYDNLDIRYLKHPFGFDVVIPVINDVNEFFLFIRDEKEFVVGGIHIKSPKTARKAYERFVMECEDAKRMKGKYAEETAQRLLRELKIEYGHYLDAKHERKGGKRDKIPVGV